MSTPPSARTAAPLVADDIGLVRNAASLAISDGSMKRWRSDVSFAPAMAVGDGEGRSLRHAVVGHVGGDVHSRLAADEQDAPPAALDHARQGVPGEPDATHHVDVEVALPLGVLDVLEDGEVEDADVVDQDVDIAQPLEQMDHLAGIGEVGGDPGDVRPGMGAPQARGRGLDAALASPVDHDRGPLRGQRLSDRVADPLRRPAHERPLAHQLQIHRVPLPLPRRRTPDSLAQSSQL